MFKALSLKLYVNNRAAPFASDISRIYSLKPYYFNLYKYFRAKSSHPVRKFPRFNTFFKPVSGKT